MASPRIRKVVFPVGGLGTRFLPATKSMPKEMLPVVDKPLIHYAFEEAKAAGIEEFIFVTGRNKNAILNHFDHAYELEQVLNDANKQNELERVRGWMPSAGSIVFTRQLAPLGLGHAVWCARNLVGDEPFAVILADDLVLSKTPCLKQMTEAWSSGNMVAVMDVPRAQTGSYGIVDIEKEIAPNIVKAKGLVEKPKPEQAPSTLSIIGRYILEPEIFSHLEEQKAGAGGEIQLTDAIARQIKDPGVYGFRFEGTRFDCGSQQGYVEANVAFALQRAELTGLKDSLRKWL